MHLLTARILITRVRERFQPASARYLR